MSAVAQFLPRAQLRQVDHVVVGAAPEQTYAAFRHLDATEFAVVRALFWLRVAPERLLSGVTRRAIRERYAGGDRGMP